MPFAAMESTRTPRHVTSRSETTPPAPCRATCNMQHTPTKPPRSKRSSLAQTPSRTKPATPLSKLRQAARMTDSESTQPKADEAGQTTQPDEDQGRKGNVPEPCGKCGERMGHKRDCAWKYRSCWTYGIKKQGEGGSGERKE
ncbi:1,3-beta-glucanosyltransferase [Tolypocladium paradoxum]|uniref:1,3-beta-glucanosyltransferase n=1 Tax=Tolypocladium paradoxum TaxID=94208 RepID=A0A2S4KPC2_9HYPO|nr:1,3-beta-glucanosyltransferase [Tolypocladium paradoxum]